MGTQAVPGGGAISVLVPEKSSCRPGSCISKVHNFPAAVCIGLSTLMADSACFAQCSFRCLYEPSQAGLDIFKQLISECSELEIAIQIVSSVRKCMFNK